MEIFGFLLEGLSFIAEALLPSRDVKKKQKKKKKNSNNKERS